MNSLGLGDPPTFDPIVLRRSSAIPTCASSSTRTWQWTDATDDERSRRTGAVQIVDFKGRYGLEIERAGRAAGDCTSACSRPSRTRSSRTRTTCPRSRRCSTARRPHLLRRADPHRRRPRRQPIPARTATSSPAGSGDCATCSRSTRRARSAASRCTAAAWASSTWPRSDPAARRDVLTGRAERHAPAGLQRVRRRRRTCPAVRCPPGRLRWDSAAAKRRSHVNGGWVGGGECPTSHEGTAGRPFGDVVVAQQPQRRFGAIPECRHATFGGHIGPSRALGVRRGNECAEGSGSPYVPHSRSPAARY